MLNLLSFASVMKSIGGVLLAVVILLAMVTIHEFGHYVAGKILGFKINEFSVGFGPAVFKKRSKKTGELFALRIVPLGGYCAFDGEDEDDEQEQENEKPFAEITEKSDETEAEYPEPKGERFNDQPPWKRIIVLLAGATMNYILAVFLIVLMFACVGRPLYKVVEENPNAEPTPETAVIENTNGLQTDDIILKINGKNMYMITDYMDILDGKDAGDKVEVTVLRGGEKIKVEMILAIDADIKNLSDTNTLLHSMGIYGLYTVTEKQGFFESVGHSFAYSVKIGGTVLRSLGELLTGKLGLDAMGGPVTTIKVTSQAASSGLLSFLNIAAFIGVNLAVFNLLPIPALDGCKVIFCIIEWIRKKPVNRKVEAMIHFIGIIFLFGFAILVDLLQLF
ncbi:MAG: site-2 protease family protein [Clostridia bacterium]|nr:site-2 protease family protein [Clostridia bacterium]